MTDPNEELPGVLEELRRRRVGRVAIEYVAASFAVLELALWILPWFGAAERGFRPVLGLLVMGFPVAIVLAWTYDVTAGRIVKTPDDLEGAEPEAAGRSWLWATLLFVAVGVVLEVVRSR